LQSRANLPRANECWLPVKNIDLWRYNDPMFEGGDGRDNSSDDLATRIFNAAAIAAALIILFNARVPESGDRPVAYGRLDVFYTLRPDTWNYGETKTCLVPSDPEEKPGLILCGTGTMEAWGQRSNKPVFKSQVYQSTRTMRVKFPWFRLRIGRNQRWWECQRSPQEIVCH
jgi:hypothetical protein